MHVLVGDEPGSFAESLRNIGRSFTVMLGIPATFKPHDLEAEFLASYAAKAAQYRQASVLLGLMTWIIFFGWDLYHGKTNAEFHLAFPTILKLRGLGTALLLLVALLIFSRRVGVERFASSVMTAGSSVTFFILLIMTYVAPFPYNFVFYFIGLLLVILFVAGLFKLRIWPFLCFVFVSLGSSTVILAQIDVSAHRLGSAASYYYVASLTFLIYFFFAAYASVVQQERAARSEFARERLIEQASRDLKKSNRDLVAANDLLVTSERETHTRTAAIVALKEDLRLLAEQQNNSKSKFLADASHDLRQPLQALSNFLSAARHALDVGDQTQCSEFLDMSMRARDLTSSLFGAILDISQLEAGTVKPTYSTFDVAALVLDVVQNLEAVANAADVKLHVRTSAHAVWVRSDRHLLARLLINLVGNGIKYRDPIKAGGNVVVIGMTAFSSHVRLDVIDNGLGIDKQHWSQVFEPFRQLNNPGRDREKGVGLGLSIVNAVIGALSGHRLEMNSRLAKGTRFSVSVPREDAIEDLKVDPSRRGQGDIAIELSELYILYIEDDMIVRRSTMAIFDTYQLRYEALASLAELDEYLEGFERVPDVLLTDYRLTDGIADDAISKVNDACDVAVPTVVLTGEIDELAFGSATFIQVVKKPASADAIMRALAAAAQHSGFPASEPPCSDGPPPR